ncbi:MAG: hypothetical protein HYX68_18995 [Planctomycetes bacterium]|nr:hypothetical protein [Planctomycetota bacterium]
MTKPEIYGDFNNLDSQNRIRLTTLGSIQDIARLGLHLKDGLALTVAMDDADDAGNPDDLMADAVVRYNEKEKCWVAQIDWSKVQNRSERAESKNGELRAAPVRRTGGKKKETRERKAAK